ncbi:hypothetical protein [Glycomyces sp. NRRL B-16210]|uniref:hypothetical protein n=1 Tax=Glycomyces sp. NRRL B-16210 TaxID=1463821 RepID=UPI0004C2051F|nr:hypothetical protein [Glycomyces sp. NRRL B-16210]
MNATAIGFIEIAIIVLGILAWLAGVLGVMYRGFILPGVTLDELKFKVAERRGLLADSPDEPPRAASTLREQTTANEVRALAAAQGESRRHRVWEAWRSDPQFRAEVQRRYRDHYPPRHAYIALLCGGAWSLTFVLIEPLQDILVPDDLEILFPVYVLVAPLWIAVAVMLLLEKAHRRRAAKRQGPFPS